MCTAKRIFVKGRSLCTPDLNPRDLNWNAFGHLKLLSALLFHYLEQIFSGNGKALVEQSAEFNTFHWFLHSSTQAVHSHYC